MGGFYLPDLPHMGETHGRQGAQDRALQQHEGVPEGEPCEGNPTSGVVLLQLTFLVILDLEA